MHTQLIWTPRYYGQLALSLGKESPYIFSEFNLPYTDTALIWTLSLAPQCLYCCLTASFLLRSQKLSQNVQTLP